ncbi:MAG: alanine racemase, partial [Clostridia bacterium]|nr:alanine racemase [Clostridia bacterium]
MTKAFVVEREAVSNNLKIIRAKAENAIVIGVLKGNAYGFGLIEVARLMREQGIHFLAVTEPGDLVKLRDAGF